MKIKRIICATFAVLLIITASSCGKTGQAAKIEGTYFSMPVYKYYMSCYKQYWLALTGADDSDSFWQSKTDGGVTNSEYFTQLSVEALKKRIASVFLFDSFELKLTDEEYRSIDRLIAGINISLADHGGIEGDDMFKKLSLTEEDLRQILIIDSKTAALTDHLYGDDGVRRVVDGQREEYYQNNYYRFKHFYLMNYDYKRDGDGNIIFDKDGNAEVVETSDQRFEEKAKLCEDVLYDVVNGADIDKYIDEYSEELSKDNYKNGHYLADNGEYYDVLADFVMGLQIGETKMLQSPVGLHVVQRLPLDEGAWGKEENKAGGDFDSFEQAVTDFVFDEYIKPFADKVEISEEARAIKLEDMPYTDLWRYTF